MSLALGAGALLLAFLVLMIVMARRIAGNTRKNPVKLPGDEPERKRT